MVAQRGTPLPHPPLSLRAPPFGRHDLGAAALRRSISVFSFRLAPVPSMPPRPAPLDSTPPCLWLPSSLQLTTFTFYPSLIGDRFGVDVFSVQIKLDEHRAAADLAIVIPFGGHLAGCGPGDREALETGGAGDLTVHTERKMRSTAPSRGWNTSVAVGQLEPLVAVAPGGLRRMALTQVNISSNRAVRKRFTI